MEGTNETEQHIPKKATTHKGKLYLNSLLPQLKENPKQCIYLNTSNSSEIMRWVLNNLFLMRREYSKKLNHKNEIKNIFIDKSDIEYFAEKNNCSWFTYTADMKKRPMDLIMGSLYNRQWWDAFEFEVVNFIPVEYFKNINIDSYMKPVLIFQGEVFETEYNYERLKKFWIDYFKLFDIEETIISTLKRLIVISCDSNEKVVKLRSYQVDGEIIEGNLGNLKLQEVGPSLDLKERKFQIADDETYKRALKQPRAVMDIKKKILKRML